MKKGETGGTPTPEDELKGTVPAGNIATGETAAPAAGLGAQIREKLTALRTAKPADRIGLAREIGSLRSKVQKEFLATKATA